MDISNRILSTEPVKWKELDWLQGNLKEMSKTSFEKLKKSLLVNSFIQPFNVWKNGKLWILDGHHRKKAMEELEKEGHKIPEELPANFVSCKDLKEAKKLVLIYSSIYARATDETLYEYINLENLDFDELKLEIDLPDLNLGKFERGYMTDEVIEDEAPEPPTEAKTVKGDLYELGKHRLLCGDSTNSDDVAKLMDGKRADMVFTDPPYGIKAVSKNGTVGGENICKPGVYSEIIGDETTDTAEKCYELIKSLGVEVLCLWGGNYFSKFCPPSSCWIVWDKRGDMASNNFADCELAWTNLDKPSRVYKQTWCGMIKEGENGKRVHPTQKPINLAVWCLKELSPKGDSVLDLFLGSGSTLIACETINRNCYGIEIEPKYCDVIVQRYCNFVKSNKIKLNGKEIEWKQN